MNTVINLRFLCNSGKLSNSLETGGFSRKTELHGVSEKLKRYIHFVFDIRHFSMKSLDQRLATSIKMADRPHVVGAGTRHHRLSAFVHSPHAVALSGLGRRQLCILYSVRTRHSLYQLIMMETDTVSRTSGTKSTLTQPIAREELIVYCRRKSQKGKFLYDTCVL
jgi:hypothetical protein